MKRTMLYAVLGLLVLGLPQVVSASPSVTLLVDGKRLPTSPAPVLRGGRVYVPVTVFRPIGLAVSMKGSRRASVGWPESDLIIDFRAGVDYYTPDSPEPARVKLPGTAFVSRGVLMVPLRALLDDSDYGTSLTAKWDSATRTLNVRRSRRWLRQRLEMDDEFIKGQPDVYSHVWLGDYVPVVPSQEIERAERLDASGEWFDAAKVLRSLISAKPFTWESDAWRMRDEWKAYQPLGRILIRERPEGANGHYYLAIGLAVEGQYAAAEEEFRRSAEIDAARADAHFGAGWGGLETGKGRLSIRSQAGNTTKGPCRLRPCPGIRSDARAYPPREWICMAGSGIRGEPAGWLHRWIEGAGAAVPQQRGRPLRAAASNRRPESPDERIGAADPRPTGLKISRVGCTECGQIPRSLGTTALRLVTSSFSKMLATWSLTVASAMKRLSAISRFDAPCAIIIQTSTSRSEQPVSIALCLVRLRIVDPVSMART